jgi:VWA domain containing CoxE-like protein
MYATLIIYTLSYIVSVNRWRLILGRTEEDDNEESSSSFDLSEEQQGMDRTLEALYQSDRQGNLGKSSPNINKWLGDIRKYFPKTVVQVMQRDALDRLGLKQMLLEPELLSTLEPDVHLVGTLLSLKALLPAKTHETARMVIEKVVRDLEKKLELPLRQALQGALNKANKTRRPRQNEIDWHATIRKNLKHYQTEQRTIIPEVLVGQGRRMRSMKTVILLVDQSGSMAESVVYSGVMAAVMASMRSIKTHIVFFDTAVVDMTAQLHDPVELLFSAQLGGGTDIAKALAFGQTLITQPLDTICLLISDLYEGGNVQQMHRTAAQIHQSGVQFITLLALSDGGTPAFDHDNAQIFTDLGIPTFACTPDRFPEMMAAAVKRENLERYGKN